MFFFLLSRTPKEAIKCDTWTWHLFLAFDWFFFSLGYFFVKRGNVFEILELDNFIVSIISAYSIRL